VFSATVVAASHRDAHSCPLWTRAIQKRLEFFTKVRYLLSVLAATPSGQDPRRNRLIQAVLDDLSRLSREM
jgi:hypothetical protein